jgi:hypothetical protein
VDKIFVASYTDYECREVMLTKAPDILTAVQNFVVKLTSEEVGLDNPIIFIPEGNIIYASYQPVSPTHAYGWKWEVSEWDGETGAV